MTNWYHNRRVYTLLEITQSIQRAFQKLYSQAYWIKAEMHKLNYYKYSGHCYPDLLEKQEGKIVAQMRAILWSDDYRRINGRFLEILGEPLKDGINILFYGKLNYSPVHGLSINILDIDPAYTLGDLEKEKQETIKRLKQENLFNKNRQLLTPPLLKRLAIISVETSRGLADFRQVIDNNPWHYRLEAVLFPALLQGDKAPESIMNQLERIRRIVQHFDAVAIIRGGGGDIGLSCYNHYHLARMVATFPIPVLTGIGHSTNETVVEMVAYYNAITPTALAEYLLNRFREFDKPLNEAIKRIKDASVWLISLGNEELSACAADLVKSTNYRLSIHQESISGFSRQLIRTARADLRITLQQLLQWKNRVQQYTPQALAKAMQQQEFLINLLGKNSRLFLRDHHMRLNTHETHMKAMHPDNILKRGFSITLYNGRSLTTTSNLRAAETVETILYQGKFTSQITQINPETFYE